MPWWAWLTLFVALVALLPVGFDSGYVRRVAFDTVLYMLLALGLNVVVGWGGLLDLGFVAFYGIGAYTYAVLNSDKYDIHLGALPTMFVVLAIGATAGFLVGLPSRRLSGDYLAIVTLFFLQIFLTVTINSDGIRGAQPARRPERRAQRRPADVLRPRAEGRPPRASSTSPTSTSRWRSSSSSTWRFGSSTTRGPAGPGGRCARIRSRRS